MLGKGVLAVLRAAASLYPMSWMSGSGQTMGFEFLLRWELDGFVSPEHSERRWSNSMSMWCY